MSNERDVDPVGACVGMKGSRVQAIIRELRGEKIDIIEWSEDPAIFAANALSPAKVSKVAVLDFENKKLQVTVENDQQSLAIGKRGQNVRLAARLVGWDIDIRSEEEMKREVATQMEQLITADIVPVTYIEGITISDSQALAEHGIETVEQLAAASVDDVSEWLDLSVDEAEQRLEVAREIVAVRESLLAQQAAEAQAEAVAEEIGEAASTEAANTDDASAELAAMEAELAQATDAQAETSLAAENAGSNSEARAESAESDSPKATTDESEAEEKADE
jgi:N utilization substance protein A